MISGTVYRYDAAGRQTENIAIAQTLSLNAADGVHNRQYTPARQQTEYNAFGEVVRRGLNGGGQEYFDYDNAGRVWRSNAGDGIDKIYLYDVQGNQVQQLISQGRDLSDEASYSYAQLATTAGLPYFED